MIVVWFEYLCLVLYLEAMAKGELKRPQPPKRCQRAECGKRRCYWRHGSYERSVRDGEAAPKVRIERFKCKYCGRTASIAPVFVVKRRWYSRRVIAERVHGYAASSVSYRRLANGPGFVPCSSPSQIWRWVDALCKRAKGLLVAVQRACILAGATEQELIAAEQAVCERSIRARTAEKRARLNELSRLVSFSEVGMREKGSKALESLKPFLREKVDTLQRIFAGEPAEKTTPQKVAPMRA
jgi:Domain of unknown function (DUF6431)